MLSNDTIGYESIWSGTAGKFEIVEYSMENVCSTDPEKQREVQGWLNGLAEPWSETSVGYSVSPNHASGEIPHDKRWIANYNSIVYDGIEAHVIAYAETPQEALQKCIALKDKLLNAFYTKPLDNED